MAMTNIPVQDPPEKKVFRLKDTLLGKSLALLEYTTDS